MRLVKCNSLKSWTSLKEYRRLKSTEYVDWKAHRKLSPPNNKVIFVSHRWITPEHPDPDGSQLRELQRRLDVLKDKDKTLETAVLFYDYSSTLQRPRSTREEALFQQDMKSLRSLARAAEKVIILSEGYKDYKNRAWCFFELVVTPAEHFHFFQDQGEVKADAAFQARLMTKPRQLGVKHVFTSEKANYKVNLREVAVIVAVFQHLRSCRATHPEDVPLIRRELADHFNGREVTSYGRLVTGLAKFFDLTFIVASPHLQGEVECRPYFEEEEWVRLPPPPDYEQSLWELALREGSEPLIYAVPVAQFRKMRGQYSPFLRLTIPGVSNFDDFLGRFQRIPSWKRYVVGPLEAAGFGPEGVEKDPFPTIDHVVHTILNRPPGFMVGPSQLFLPILPAVEEALVDNPKLLPRYKRQRP